VNEVLPSRFQTTSWSLVLAAGAAPTPDSERALASLCHIYWQPVYAFIRKRGYDSEHARDLAQGFFTFVLEKHGFSRADPERGRFRTFLLTSVKNYLANERDRASARKRGGGQIAIPIDPVEAESWYAPEAVDEITPEHLYQRRWALALLERVFARLRDHAQVAGKTDRFDRLAAFLVEDDSNSPYDQLAEEMGTSVGALRVAVHRLRRSYRDLLRAEIAETVSSSEEIDDEVRFLFESLGKKRVTSTEF